MEFSTFILLTTSETFYKVKTILLKLEERGVGYHNLHYCYLDNSIRVYKKDNLFIDSFIIKTSSEEDINKAVEFYNSI